MNRSGCHDWIKINFNIISNKEIYFDTRMITPIDNPLQTPANSSLKDVIGFYAGLYRLVIVV
jgi:hypothetical protein